MTILNCTPHAINIVTPEGNPIVAFPKGEILPRLSQETVTVGEINGIPLTETSFGETVNLPEPKEDTFLIVSRLVKTANPDRKDLLVPNGIVRNEQGQIVGSTSLARN